MTKEKQTGHWLDLGLMSYEPSFAIQEQVLQARMGGQLPTTIILQENFPVFTIGRSGSRFNILASAEDLQRIGVEVQEVNRGGDVTYHGPGQLIVSPLFFLGDIDLNANQYLHRLENVLIELLAHYGIHTRKKKDHPGVWWHQAKIAAVGIAVRHGFTFHGFSLNVSLDLTPFDLINPCGVSRMPITSIHQALGHILSLAEVKAQLRTIMEQRFALNTREVSWSNFTAIFKTVRPDSNIKKYSAKQLHHNVVHLN